MILYYLTKFLFNSINSFRVMGRGHFPSPRAQTPKKSPGRIGLIESTNEAYHMDSNRMNSVESRRVVRFTPLPDHLVFVRVTFSSSRLLGLNAIVSIGVCLLGTNRKHKYTLLISHYHGWKENHK